MTEQQLKVFGFEVRQRRQELKLERDAIAALLDVHARTYAKWENGQSDPPLGKAIAIAQILKTTLSELLGESAIAVSNAFNNNTQEGEHCTIHNNIVSFDREVMQEIHQRFAFFEQILQEERAEKKELLQMLKKA